MRVRTRLVATGLVLGCCLPVTACGNDNPTGVRIRSEGDRLRDSEGYVGKGRGDVTTQADTVTRGIGGFGSGN
jgi:hypothetical protein